MLSKSRGQVLRIAAIQHVLFTLDSDELCGNTVTDAAIKAAINFVQVTCQQAAYIGGQGKIEDELHKCEAGMCATIILYMFIESQYNFEQLANSLV